MRLIRLGVKDYGCFSGCHTWEFEPGLNIIAKPNEWGKSTICRAIRHALFASPLSRRAEVLGCRSWGAATSFELTIEWEDEYGTYGLSKDFENGHCALCLPDGTAFTGKPAEEQAKTAIGIEEPVFCATAYVAPHSMVAGKSDTPRVVEALRAIACQSGPDAPLTSVLKMLDERINELRVGDEASPGRKYSPRPGEIQRARNALRELEGRREQAAREAHFAQEKMLRLATLRHDESEMSAALATASRWVEIHNRYRDLERRVGEAQQLTQEADRRLRTIEDLGARISRLDDELAPFGKLTQLTEQEVETARKWREDAASVRITGQNAKQQRDTSRADASLKRRILGTACAVFAVIAGTIGYVAPSVRFPAVVVACAMALLSMWAFVSRHTGRPVATTLASVDPDELDARVHRFSVDAGFPDLDALLDSWRKCFELMRARSEAVAQRSVVMGDQSEAEIRSIGETRRGAKLDIEHQMNATDMQAVAGLPPTELIRFSEDAEQLPARLNETVEQAHALTGELRSASATPSDVEELDDQVERARSRLALLSRRGDVLELTRHALEAARDSVLSSVHETIRPDVETHLANLTCGRYETVAVGPDFVASIFLPGQPDARRADQTGHDFSTGTLDQIYFAMRLALLKAVSGGKMIPLILDDPFAHYDTSRTAAGVDTLRTLADKGQQTILFCCKNA